MPKISSMDGQNSHKPVNFPPQIQEALSSKENLRTFLLVDALLQSGKENAVPITEGELQCGLSRCNVTAPEASRSCYRWFSSSVKESELYTPQGRFFSPILFGVFMHYVLSLLPDVPRVKIICNTNDICIHTQTIKVQQYFPRSYYSAYGVIVSPRKSRIFSPHSPRTLPDFTVRISVILLCMQHTYLGEPVTIALTTLARQCVHPQIQDLACLQQHLIPLKWLLNNATGIYTSITMTIYSTFRFLQLDVTAGSAIFSSDTEPQEWGWVGRRLPDSSTFTLCEL
ncbi:hypothetical protein SK128_017770 [Halocaridina rubra]|uniref:Uncharacterized protein n=1 Tax=Halocaridina rubra TaxID=373956 RepID=A0AAN9ADF1_HALRR